MMRCVAVSLHVAILPRFGRSSRTTLCCCISSCGKLTEIRPLFLHDRFFSKYFSCVAVSPRVESLPRFGPSFRTTLCCCISSCGKFTEIRPSSARQFFLNISAVAVSPRVESLPRFGPLPARPFFSNISAVLLYLRGKLPRHPLPARPFSNIQLCCSFLVWKAYRDSAPSCTTVLNISAVLLYLLVWKAYRDSAPLPARPFFSKYFSCVVSPRVESLPRFGPLPARPFFLNLSVAVSPRVESLPRFGPSSCTTVFLNISAVLLYLLVWKAYRDSAPLPARPFFL
ncbi:hypothetical protein J6590_080839 [Homalodisca vitripennis]|nr:hypothetical protein J6590_080839 [Homalodisca vitripennis]